MSDQPTATAACDHRWKIDPNDPLSFLRACGRGMFLVCEKCGHKERER